jgi:APA family basic amino acid/polyamine antiporter
MRLDGSLSRRLNLPLLILYGVGVTIGAGIYVLIGAVAGHAGVHAPLSFVIAAVVMGLTVGSYAELCTRYPVAAGEAAYVRAAFHQRSLSTATGVIMIASGVIAAAAVALGATGYIAQFIDTPAWLTVTVVIVGLGAVSMWGILESVLLASAFTIIEVTGLMIIIFAALYSGVPFGSAVLVWPPFESVTWIGVGYASLLAFFAFTGFEDLTNMVEEAKSPERNIAIAMGVTLVVTTMLSVAITAIAVVSLPSEQLSTSTAPLSLVYRKIAGVSPALISGIAIVATLNTIIAQMTMATRVVYGMARQGDLPSFLGAVNRTTATPVIATAVIISLVLVLALFVSFEKLAEFTSLATLVVFALVNLALISVRLKGMKPTHTARLIRVPLIVPILGLMSCMAMIATSLF